MNSVNENSGKVEPGPKPIAVVTGDTHGQRCAWARHPSLEGDSYFALDQMVDHCLARRLPLVLLGDVFDTRSPDSHTVVFFAGRLSKLHGAGLGVYFIQGQHEYRRRSPWLALVPGAWHVHGTRFRLPSDRSDPSVSFYGLDFTNAAALPAALAGVPPDTRVLLAHQVWEEHMGKRASPEGALRQVPRVSLVLTGDFHGHRVTEVAAEDGRVIRVASPGSTCMQALDEDPDKYFFELYDDLSLRSVGLACRPVCREVVRTAGELDDVVRKVYAIEPDFRVLPENIATPIVHVRYRDNLPEVESRLRAAGEGRAHLFLTPLRAERGAAPGRRDPQDGPRSLEWHLSRRREADSLVYSTALRLWRAADLNAEIDALIEESARADADLEARGVWDATRDAAGGEGGDHE